ncbi:MAG: hypothetical protein IPG67_08385 [Acidobacteria bacterium]|nr:hypothetical protein [Acidobacteriota bacterium]
MTIKVRTLMTVIVVLTLILGAFAQKPGSQPAQVNLDVVIDDLVSQGLFGFASDGGGTYVHGSQGVAASFLSTGVLSFKTGNRTATAYYSTPVQPVGAPLAGSTSGSSYFLTFVRSGQYLQTMAIGSSRCEGLVGSMPISTDYARYVGYHAGKGTLSDLGYMLVTHPDANTWIMDSNSSGICGSTAYDNIARINDAKTKGKANDIFHGRYLMPLRLVLTRH